jgi:hypothetical protein
VQRLDDSDIFLRPDGAVARIRRWTADGVVTGARVSLPAGGIITVTSGVEAA